jgi:hypothetical protein
MIMPERELMSGSDLGNSEKFPKTILFLKKGEFFQN